MQPRYSMLAILIAFTIVASACAPQAASSGGSVPVTGPTSAPVPAYGGGGSSQAASPTQAPASGSGSSASAGGQVAVAQSASLGFILVDSKGMTLYLFTKDTQNSGASTCYGKCATAWPPLLSSGAPAAASGLDASKLGTISRTDGATQVTYNGWPLYYYAKDKQAGDVTGQKVGGVWFVLSPSGDAIQ